MDKKSCEQIMGRYYQELYNYCFAKLKYNKQSAEDCTQELFMVFLKKHENLAETENIRIWLYHTADNVIKVYLRKHKSNDISLEANYETINTLSENTYQNKTDLSDWLTDDEIKLIRFYYDTDYGNKESVAKKLGITVTALYQRINKIKQKIRNNKKIE